MNAPCVFCGLRGTHAFGCPVAPVFGEPVGVYPARSPYRVPQETWPPGLIDAALAVAKAVLERGHVAHVLVTDTSGLIQAHSAVDGQTRLGAVSIPDGDVEAFLASLEGKR